MQQSINVATGEVTESSSEPSVISIESKQQEARALRDSALKECDWTQAADSPLLGNQVWLDYRQSLRDASTISGWDVDPVAVVADLIAASPK